MYRCFFCKHELIWNSDFDNEDYDIETPGVVGVYTCPHCGSEYTVFKPNDFPEK